MSGLATIDVAFRVPTGAVSTSVAMSTTSANGPVLKTCDYALVTVTADCFVRRGTNPTATTSDLPLLANRQYRLTGILDGERLAFVMATGTGTAYVTVGV